MHADTTGLTRRQFIAATGLTLAAGPALARSLASEPAFKISLAQWSLHKTLYAGDLAPERFPQFSRERFGIDAVELVNQFYKDQTPGYFADLRKRADDAGVEVLLIMCDGEGDVGHPEEAERVQTAQNHKKWLDAAATLGCHAIRVNAASQGSFEEQQKLAADGLDKLCDLAEPMGLSVLVENHGGLSSHGGWLAGVMEMINRPTCGTLPDFGNFCMDWGRADDPEAWYDRYKGVKELMPHAQAVSAKSYAFDESGEETSTDYTRMMNIVLSAGYNGYVGIEFEGGDISEAEGINATKKLLERVRAGL